FFVLELPPFRRPRLGQVLVRSVLDRTLFVLGRAVTVAAPAGGLVWVLANTSVGGSTLLAHLTGWLGPAGAALGLDGFILAAFVLGLPANEIVLPILLMSYLSTGAMVEVGSLEALGSILAANGWTGLTALCFMLFSLLHWPCATTLLTIRKETMSARWTAAAALLPTAVAAVVCAAVAAAGRLLGAG
ncbi:MAG: nucleoside recognition domain-containing protein, partial [Bacillota bacterium]